LPTPGVAASLRSTPRAQFAHVMPCTENFTVEWAILYMMRFWPASTQEGF